MREIILRYVRYAQRSKATTLGYIRMTEFTEQTTEGLKKAITDITAKVSNDMLKGYILDLRNNPGGLLDQAIFGVERIHPKRARSSPPVGAILMKPQAVRR